jgi:hypothetical protein
MGWTGGSLEGLSANFQIQIFRCLIEEHRVTAAARAWKHLLEAFPFDMAVQHPDITPFWN